MNDLSTKVRIELRDLGYRTALQSVSQTWQGGQMIGVLGLNGAEEVFQVSLRRFVDPYADCFRLSILDNPQNLSLGMGRI